MATEVINKGSAEELAAAIDDNGGTVIQIVSQNGRFIAFLTTA